MVVGVLDSTSKKLKKCIEELVVVISTALLQKTAFTRDSSYIEQGFRLRVRVVETGLGWFDKKVANEQMSKWGGGVRGGNLFQKPNRSERECKSIGKYRFWKQGDIMGKKSV